MLAVLRICATITINDQSFLLCTEFIADTYRLSVETREYTSIPSYKFGTVRLQDLDQVPSYTIRQWLVEGLILSVYLKRDVLQGVQCGVTILSVERQSKRQVHGILSHRPADDQRPIGTLRNGGRLRMLT